MEQGYNNNHTYGADPRAVVKTAHIGPNAVSWRAILGGTFVILALSAILITLGSGLGLSMASPMDGEGVTAATIGVSAVIWMIIVQWFTSFTGGYIAGRLRNRWEGLHGDEVFFRDSAHGLIAWAVACVISVMLVISAVSNVAGAGAQTLGLAAAGAASNNQAGEAAENAADAAFDYYVDTAFRAGTRGSAPALDDASRDEVAGIFWRSMNEEGGMSASDKSYLTSLVSRQTGLAPAEAEGRVDQALASLQADKQKAIETADAVRKKAATLSILTALSMVIGAFIASIAAILGGRHRDAF